MSDINKTLNKGLNLPEHYDPSVEKLRENMNIIDSLLQKSIPNDLQTTSDGEDNINNLITTGRYFVKNSATGCPITGNTGIVDVFKAGNYVLQEWRSVSSSSLVYRRHSSNGGSGWYSWTKVWNGLNDGSDSGLDADTLDGTHLSSLYRKDYTATDFNSATSEGKYKINGGTNAPNTTCADWVCLVYYLSGGANELYQIAMEECHTVPDLGESKGNLETPNSTEYSTGTPCMFVRKRIDGTWYAWETIFNSGVITPVRTFRSTTSQNIDNCKEEGFYDYKFISSSSTLPESSTGYGLIVKSLNGADSTGSDCCLQILMTNGSTNIYVRTYYQNNWSSWKLLGGTAKDILTKLKTVDGAGSGLDSDTVDGKHASDFVQSVKSTTTTNIDNVTLEGMYEYTSITSSKTLPFTGTGSTYGLIVKSVKGSSSYNCCFQILLRDDYKFIHMRYFHGGVWTNWTKINPDTKEILSNLKAVDGDGSELDSDLLDGRHGYGYAYTGTSGFILTNGLPTPSSAVQSQFYVHTGTSITGSSEPEPFGIFQIYNTPKNYARIAVSINTGKVYVQTTGASAWSEITPLIPVLSANPSNPSEGQMWILK